MKDCFAKRTMRLSRNVMAGGLILSGLLPTSTFAESVAFVPRASLTIAQYDFTQSSRPNALAPTGINNNVRCTKKRRILIRNHLCCSSSPAAVSGQQRSNQRHALFPQSHVLPQVTSAAGLTDPLVSAFATTMGVDDLCSRVR